MSEFQYYEWQALDRALTPAQLAAVRKLSSHIAVTPTRAQVDYSWGDFKHDPLQVLARYFDAFLYYANWGSRRLAFRLPAGLMDAGALRPYLDEEWAALHTLEEQAILLLEYPDDVEGDWEESWDEDETLLAELAPLRDELLAGDYRVLYLVWLLNVYAYEDDEAVEPPIPPGLGALTAAQEAFMDFFGVDPFWVQAAAQASAPLRPPPALDIPARLARLPRAEADDFLRRLAADEPQLIRALLRRLEELGGAGAPPQPAAPGRTWAALHATATALRNQADARARADAQARRTRELEELAPHAEETRRTIEATLTQTKTRAYAGIVAQLINLRDLAAMQGRLPEFDQDLALLKARHAGRRALLERIHAAGLGRR